MASVRIVDYFSLDDAFLEARSETLFCSPAWVRMLQKTYDFECYAVIDDKNEICIPMILVDNLMGKKLTCLPFSDYTDINTDTPERYVDLIAKIETNFPDTPIILKTIGNTGEPDVELWGDTTRTAYYHRIDTRDADKLAKKQSSSFGRNVRKAEKNGVSVRIKKDKAALEDFYRLYHGLRLNKFGSIPQPYGFFENIFDSFIADGRGFILEAVVKDETSAGEKTPAGEKMLDGGKTSAEEKSSAERKTSEPQKILASVVILQHKKVLYYKFGASDKDGLSLRPNDLIFRELIDYAHKNGIHQVDLGLSGTGDSYKGLVRFKEGLGGVPHNIIYYKKTTSEQEDKNKALGQWLNALTDEIASTKPDPETLSNLSSLIYPLFA